LCAIALNERTNDMEIWTAVCGRGGRDTSGVRGR